jgi:cytochrome c biogenesis protein CcdA
MPTFDLLAFPFAAGLIAAFNPCGFAMLPTYLTYFLGLDDEDSSLARSVLRGGKVGAALTLGFLTVFAIFGVLFEVILSGGARGAVQDALWIVTIGSGVLIFVLGLAMVRGFQPVLNIPKLQMGTGSREVGSMYLFGVSYGVVSLGCTIGPFLVAVTGSVANTEAQFGSLWAFVAYALGMGAVIIFLTMALAAGRSGVANKMRSLLPKINRASGVLLVLAGVYLVSYGWFQKDPLNNGNVLIDWVEGVQASVVNWINNDLGAERAGLIMLITAVIIGAGAAIWRYQSRSNIAADQLD